MIDARILAYDYDEEAEGFGEPPVDHRRGFGPLHAIAVGITVLGAVVLVLAALDVAGLRGTWAGFLGSFGLLTVGATAVIWARYRHRTPGIHHDGNTFSAVTYRGWLGWGLGLALTSFYVLIYFRDEATGLFGGNPIGGVVLVTEPLAHALTGHPPSHWFLYGLLYTLSVLVFGGRMWFRYRHNRYHLIRTGSVMFFQLGFAFLVPAFLMAMEQPEFYFTYFWPLKPEYLFPSTVASLTDHPGGLGVFMVFWGLVMIVVATPVLTFFYGKRWYCSWVCGCGGLAETMGDPFRQLSDKSTTAWKYERVIIHSVLVGIVALTLALWLWPSAFSTGFRKAYAIGVMAMFSGVVGVGFYPLMGSRVWCRFGCPLAAILGLLQRYFSRFRITTNGGQCMSCGNCSTYCEMGIDVRAYAQQGKNIVRASCVGCGVCAAVCPRGVLRLENGKTTGDRYEGAEQPLSQFVRDLTGPPEA